MGGKNTQAPTPKSPCPGSIVGQYNVYPGAAKYSLIPPRMLAAATDARIIPMNRLTILAPLVPIIREMVPAISINPNAIKMTGNIMTAVAT